MKNFTSFRAKVCTPKTQEIFDEYLKAYRGQGYWIPELSGDVDVETIKGLLPLMEEKLSWIKAQKVKVEKATFPTEKILSPMRSLLDKLLVLKKSEISEDEKLKIKSRQESLLLLKELQKKYEALVKSVSFYSNFKYPVDHLKNRKVYDQYRENEDLESIKIANFSFLYRKLMEDGAYYQDKTGSDIYLRTTMDTIHFELLSHDFYLTEDTRFDLDFVLTKLEAELKKGKEKTLERLNEWESRFGITLAFYRDLTLPENLLTIEVDGLKTTPNKELIKEHNKAAERLKEFVYSKQAEVYKYWDSESELHRAIFSLETILLNEVGGVDGGDALERMDVARVVLNRIDKPKYLKISKNEFLYPYLKQLVSDATIKEERWLNALFKQGEFSFTYYYMHASSKIFCPDMVPNAKKLRVKNVEIALKVLKEEDSLFKATRYFSRASMIGRIHMDSIWEDYIPYPERPGLLANRQKELAKAFLEGKYHFLYTFKDPNSVLYQVLEIDGANYAYGEKNGIKIFYSHRNPHYFRYFSKTH